MNAYSIGDTVVPLVDVDHALLDQTKFMEAPTYVAVDGLRLDGLQFCREAYRLFERLLAEPDGVKRLRLRTHPFERKLITEILPLAHYLKVGIRWGGMLTSAGTAETNLLMQSFGNAASLSSSVDCRKRVL